MSLKRTFSILGALLALSAPAAAALPAAVGEWRSEKEDVVPLILEAVSRDVGQWTRRVYTRQNQAVEVNLMEGSGPRWHGAGRGLSEEKTSGLEISGETSEYEVTEIAGRYAILERHPLLPLSLVVAVSKDATLTLEGYVEVETLKDLAVRLTTVGER